MSKYPYNDIGESDIAVKYVGINYRGETANDSALPSSAEQSDAYYIIGGAYARQLAIWNGKNWDFSPWAGKDGEDGIGFNLRGIVPTPQDLPIAPDVKDAYYCTIDGKIYICQTANPATWLGLQFRGERGADGQSGADGETPQIGVNGNWYIGGVDTGVRARGVDGANGTNGMDGASGGTPSIGGNGNWYIDGIDTGVKASGQDGVNGVNGSDGTDGQDGATPYIGSNDNWWINGADTGVMARARDGQDGVDGADGQDGTDGATPQVGNNGNWWVGGVDTGLPSRGEQGEGVPAGGGAGQVLKKYSDTDYDTYWASGSAYFGGVARITPIATVRINPAGVVTCPARDFTWYFAGANIDFTDFDIVLGCMCVDGGGHMGVCTSHNMPVSGNFDDMEIQIQGVM